MTDRLQPLLAAMFDGQLSAGQIAEFRRLLADDPAARREYVRQVATHSMLQWIMAGPPQTLSVSRGLGTSVPSEVAGGHWPAAGESEISRQKSEVPGPEPLSAPIIIDTGEPLAAPRFALDSSLGGWLFSYAAATVIVGMLLLGAWAYKVSISNSRGLTAPGDMAAGVSPGAVSPRLRDSELVGRITGLADCRWSGPQNAAAAVPLGGKYVLASGLMEISYQSGAKVILEGPCTYEVESARGGFLSLGRLTARVETKGERGRGKAEETDNQKSEIRRQESPFPLPPSPFVIKTPTAVVTDLGTEFGVEVDASGTSRAHVFRGKVEVRPANTDTRDSSHAPVISLGENESAMVRVGQNHVVATTRESGQPGKFVRGLPQRVPIRLFNTGVGLKEGDPDPHWQLVARCDDLHHRPCPAVVATIREGAYLPNNARQSQWISIARDLPILPSGEYLFRTTFELKDVAPGSAELRGKFLADDFVKSIRLNGLPVAIPKKQSAFPFYDFYPFTVRKGFVEGTNVMDVEVSNFGGSNNLGTPMALLVELEGSAIRGPYAPPATSDHAPQAGGRKEASP